MTARLRLTNEELVKAKRDAKHHERPADDANSSEQPAGDAKSVRPGHKRHIENF
jgi:hypothetical protein